MIQDEYPQTPERVALLTAMRAFKSPAAKADFKRLRDLSRAWLYTLSSATKTNRKKVQE